MKKPVLAIGLAIAAAGSLSAYAQQGKMSFFVTSVGLGRGADLGGFEGADRHCMVLAEAAGAGGKTWRAYLSTHSAVFCPTVRSLRIVGVHGPAEA